MDQSAIMMIIRTHARYSIVFLVIVDVVGCLLVDVSTPVVIDAADADAVPRLDLFDLLLVDACDEDTRHFLPISRKNL